MSNKTPFGLHAFDEVLRKLRVTAPDLVYESRMVEHGKYFNDFIIARNKTLFRPVGILDWAWYTVDGMAIAIEFDAMSEYYEEMLKDKRSPDNIWKDKGKEKQLKEGYSQ
tara:strand:+ start:57 stop:386 length:330 start_codon:yes stop_codon:yes gene_type:complete